MHLYIAYIKRLNHHLIRQNKVYLIRYSFRLKVKQIFILLYQNYGQNEYILSIRVHASSRETHVKTISGH